VLGARWQAPGKLLKAHRQSLIRTPDRLKREGRRQVFEIKCVCFACTT